jgi:hypothetical protein
MTPKQVVTIDIKELKEIEIRCECGGAIRVPLPMRANLRDEQNCLACGRTLWLEKQSPTREQIENLLKAIARWNENDQKILGLSFVVTELPE